MTQTTLEFMAQNQARFLEELKTLIRIPSISTQPAHAADVQQAADWLVDRLVEIGMTEVEQIRHPAGRHPLVYGRWSAAGSDRPTVLIYGHYDVQPAEMADGWKTDPFTPHIIDGKLYARGSTDSKINVMSQLKALETLFHANQGRLPLNVTVVFEGEEESGSETFEAFAAAHGERLRADVAVISDGSIIRPEQPSLVCGLRGIISFEIHVQGPIDDLHSGHYGGSVHNPVQALAEILAALHDAEGRVTVPGFYDEVRQFSPERRVAWAGIDPIFDAAWHQVAAAPQPWGEPGYSLHERTGIRPTLEINGFYGGYTAEGVKTVLPARAVAKISCRLVPDQIPRQVMARVKAHLEAIAPPTVRLEVIEMDMGAAAVYLDEQAPAMRLAAEAYETIWNQPVLLEMAGGSVPITHTLLPLVGQVVIMGFTHRGGRAHGPNEHIVIENYFRGISTAALFIEKLASQAAAGKAAHS